MSLPASSASPQNAASCPSLVASEVPPSPSGMAQDFTVALSNIQEVRQPTRSSKVELDSVQDACCENDWRGWGSGGGGAGGKKNEEAYGVFCIKLGSTQMDA